jgi:hypothetical protein
MSVGVCVARGSRRKVAADFEGGQEPRPDFYSLKNSWGTIKSAQEAFTKEEGLGAPFVRAGEPTVMLPSLTFPLFWICSCDCKSYSSRTVIYNRDWLVTLSCMRAWGLVADNCLLLSGSLFQDTWIATGF